MNRHPVNVAHLVMGLAFLCFTAAWGLVQSDAVTGSDVRWLLPLPWLLAGAAGLVAIAVSNLRRRPTTEPGAVEPGTAGTDLADVPTDQDAGADTDVLATEEHR